MFQFTCGHIKPILGSFEINENKQKVANFFYKVKTKNNEEKRYKHVQNTLNQAEHTSWRTIEKEDKAKLNQTWYMSYVVIVRVANEQFHNDFKVGFEPIFEVIKSLA